MSEERFENGEFRPETDVYSANRTETPGVPVVNTDADGISRSRITDAVDKPSYTRDPGNADRISSYGQDHTQTPGSPEAGPAEDAYRADTYRGDAWKSETSASGPDLITGTGAAAGASAGGTSPSGTPEPFEDASAENSRDMESREDRNRSRYYSYQRGPASPSRPVRSRKPEQKKRRTLAFVLAVILVFILGAGAGAYASGKSAGASLEGEKRITAGRAENDVETGQKEADAEKETGSAGQDLPEEKKDTSSEKSVIPGVKTTESVEGSAEGGVADVAEKVMPAIVSVYNKFTQEAQFFGRSYTQEGESAGSGIIIGQTEEELLIVTNNHVVEGAESLSVQFINEENCEAMLKGTDASSDLAVISVPMSELNAKTRESIAIAELGSSDDLRIGERAIAIGNALGYGQSLTVGYISALNREITAEDGITGTFIQTDAAINPGNSGGALLNSSGQVIGINSNKIGGSAIEGMGFAIPISKAIPIIDELKSQESKTRVSEEEQGALGILGITVTSDVASAYGLPVGAYVEEIIEGSAAQQSDLSQGDIITGINGQSISGMEALQEQLSYYKAGEEVTLTVQHPMEGGSYEEREITLTLSKRSDIQSSGSQNGRNRGRMEEEIPYEEPGGEGLFDVFPFGSFGF